MVSRLVVGAGPLWRAVVDELSQRRGDLLVVTSDEHRAETLRSNGVRVERAEPIDEATLAGLGTDPDSVVVATNDPEGNAALAADARRVFPGAMLVAATGPGASSDVREAVAGVADRVVDHSRAVTDHVTERVGDESLRGRQLRRVLRDVGDRLAVVTHDNPDPDAIASAVALARIAESVGCEPDICYYGEITHQENRAFVNVLDFDLRELAVGGDLSEYDGFALVDHSRAGVNDQLPPETPIDVVIDHHPPRVPVEARFVDLRSDVGATSTLLTDYFRQSGPLIDETIATGLLFGISVDTREFRREVSPEDFEAAAYLLPHADLSVLQRIEDPSMSADTLDTIARAIRNRTREGSVLLSCIGELTDRDALAQAADRLLDLEEVNTTLVYGVKKGTIYASARARGTDLDVGEVLRDAFGRIGSAGGHADMAGAQITLGVLDSIEDRDESLHEIVRSVVDERFLEAIESRSNRLLTPVYAPGEYAAGTYGDGGGSTDPGAESDDAETDADAEDDVDGRDPDGGTGADTDDAGATRGAREDGAADRRDGRPDR
ncbi:DHH family phosphoesterase [Halomicrobium salinisoli]|uniref:DHH family phosphoesterase n=1 Tax=Halomicrobium salinisoli TaxID=2878391 RepID=UPI001CF04BC5|nr:DHH family phosphoesterase [Halomicrobium salinisoli]